jgi:uncharacterized repeat protein (TIGR04076 family)
MAKVKITVVKKLDAHEVFGDAPPAPYTHASVCGRFAVGQEFDSKGECPPNFCHWAFADIQRDIIGMLNGANYEWVGKKGLAVSCCTDGLHPVIFTIERVEEAPA